MLRTSRRGRDNPGSTPGVVTVCLVEGLQNFATTNSLFYPILAARGQGMDACSRLIYSVCGVEAEGARRVFVKPYQQGPSLGLLQVEPRMMACANIARCEWKTMDTLGFEPRAFRMRTDVMPLHHVPHECMVHLD